MPVSIYLQTLQLNNSYEPVLSGYICAKVLEVFAEEGLLKLEILSKYCFLSPRGTDYKCKCPVLKA